MKVKFMPQNIELEIALNQSVKDLADKNGIFIKSICNGLPSCAECRVKLIEGEHNILPPGKKEVNLIGTGYFIDGRRLSCQLICFGDISVDLTEQIAKEKNKASLRPQGNRKPETEISNAVAGNLIEQEASTLKSAPAAQDPQSNDQRRSEQPQRQNQQRPQQGQRHSQNNNRQQQAPRENQQPNSGRNQQQNNNRNQQQNSGRNQQRTQPKRQS